MFVSLLIKLSKTKVNSSHTINTVKPRHSQRWAHLPSCPVMFTIEEFLDILPSPITTFNKQRDSKVHTKSIQQSNNALKLT